MPKPVTKSSDEQELIDAITKYLSKKTTMPADLFDGFRLKDGYPRVQYEHGIYSDTISLEIDVERPAQ